eukprot:GHRR01014367.1.p2 GENE.GHRR01014367.1~~GHRR01014367.1.p2  ORF type:complete len:100 (+),score=40.07 GHRR01014367.1:864-1163(+)
MSSQPSSAAGGLHDFNKRVMRKQHWTTSRRQLEHNLFVEQSMMQRQKAPDLLSEQQRLVQRLSRLNLLVLEACADGNCLVLHGLLAPYGLSAAGVPYDV